MRGEVWMGLPSQKSIPKIHSKGDVGGFILVGLGFHFGSILGVGGFHFGSIFVFWEGSGRQARLRRRLGGPGANLATNPPFQRPPFGSKLASQIEPKSVKDRYKNRSKKRCRSRSGFGAILVDFLKENGGTLAPKSHQKFSSLKM